MNLQAIEEVSQLVRTLLWKVSPEIVSAAESFSSQVLYVPVSATGRSPETDPKTGALGFRPKDIKPVWAEVPMLYAMSRWMQGLVPFVKPKAWTDSTLKLAPETVLEDSRPAAGGSGAGSSVKRKSAS